MNSESEFSFVGGHPCLDFVNTAGGATKARDVDRLPSFSEIVRWALLSALIDSSEDRALRDLAQAHPSRAIDCAHALRAQRDAMYAVFEALSKSTTPGVDVSQVETAIKEAFAASHLEMPYGKPCVWNARIEAVGMNVIHHRIALTMNSLLVSDDRMNIRACEACSWLFLDPTPTKRRRWCSMAACGNRAKARRHYHGQLAR